MGDLACTNTGTNTATYSMGIDRGTNTCTNSTDQNDTNSTNSTNNNKLVDGRDTDVIEQTEESDWDDSDFETVDELTEDDDEHDGQENDYNVSGMRDSPDPSLRSV